MYQKYIDTFIVDVACLEEMKILHIESMDVDDRKVTLQPVVQSVQIENVKADIHILIQDHVISTALLLQHRNEIINRDSMTLGGDDTRKCHLPINEARNCGQ